LNVIGTYEYNGFPIDVISKGKKLAFLVDFGLMKPQRSSNSNLRYITPDFEGDIGGCFGGCARDRREAYMRRQRERHSEETQRRVDRARKERYIKDAKDIAKIVGKIVIGAKLGSGGVAAAVAGEIVEIVTHY